MAGREQTVQVQGHRLRLTNLDKVLYPATGTTKGEVIDYYSRIAPAILPLLAGRPVTRKRWPDGVGDAEHPGMSFFTKDLERGAPEWLEVVGVGYVCSLQGKTLSLRVGFANEIKKTVPDGLDVSCPDQVFSSVVSYSICFVVVVVVVVFRKKGKTNKIKTKTSHHVCNFKL